MRTWGFLLFALFFHACKSSQISAQAEDLRADEAVWIIADRRQECVGEAVQQCLVYREEGSQEWQFLYEEIKDFHPEAGRHYRVLIRKEAVENPPADASSIRYHLRKVLEERLALPIEGLINDSWGVVEMNGIAINPSENQLTIEMNSRTGRVSGFTGCNSFGGQLLVWDGDSRSISMHSLFATEMFCSGKMEVEEAFLNLLHRVNRLEFEQGELRLFQHEQLLAIARRID